MGFFKYLFTYVNVGLLKAKTSTNIDCIVCLHVYVCTHVYVHITFLINKKILIYTENIILQR